MSTSSAAPPRSSSLPRRLALTFDGKTSDYFALCAQNLALTLLTFGLYSASATVRRRRFLYAHTSLDGVRFEYVGSPLPILFGRLAVLVALVASSVFFHHFPHGAPVLSVLGLLLAPWETRRSLRLQVLAARYRGRALQLSSDYGAALRLFLAGALATVLTFGFAYPWAQRRWARFLIGGISCGGIPASLALPQRSVTKFYGNLVLALTFITLLALLLFTLTQHGFGAGLWLVPVLLFVALLADAHARLRNTLFGFTTLGPLSFVSKLRAPDLFWLYLGNVLAVVGSCGLLAPWAELRLLQYRLSRTRVLMDGSWSDFDGVGTPPARGDEAKSGDRLALA